MPRPDGPDIPGEFIFKTGYLLFRFQLSALSVKVGASQPESRGKRRPICKGVTDYNLRITMPAAFRYGTDYREDEPAPGVLRQKNLSIALRGFVPKGGETKSFAASVIQRPR